MPISLANIGWAAGFYEGEGSFIEPGWVSITQKDPEPLLRIRRLFGGQPPCRYGEYYYWRLFGVEMRQFVLTIFSLLSKRRRQQILKCKEIFTTPDACPKGHVYPSYVQMYNDYSRGRSYRICPTCAIAKNDRKNVRRREMNRKVA